MCLQEVETQRARRLSEVRFSDAILYILLEDALETIPTITS